MPARNRQQLIKLKLEQYHDEQHHNDQGGDHHYHYHYDLFLGVQDLKHDEQRPFGFKHQLGDLPPQWRTSFVF